jgi:hypothetical protein
MRENHPQCNNQQAEDRHQFFYAGESGYGDKPLARRQIVCGSAAALISPPSAPSVPRLLGFWRVLSPRPGAPAPRALAEPAVQAVVSHLAGPRVRAHLQPLFCSPYSADTSGDASVLLWVRGCGRNPLAGVRLLPPAGYAVVGVLLSPPPPSGCLGAHRRPGGTSARASPLCNPGNCLYDVSERRMPDGRRSSQRLRPRTG